jgi:RNA polymerase II subunit A C-terminal domain phosphatase SSU72
MERNRLLKQAPQRFQDLALRSVPLLGVSDSISANGYDVIITCEERCFDIVCQELSQRTIGFHNRPVHVINFDIRDTPEDAMVGARSILSFVQMLEECIDLDNEFDQRLREFMESKSCIHPMLYSVHFY